MLLGIWKNIEELEQSVNLDELNLIIKAMYEREKRQQRFAAALKGIKLDEESDTDVKNRFERAQFRAQARLDGMSEEEIAGAEEKHTLAEMGFSLTKM